MSLAVAGGVIVAVIGLGTALSIATLDSGGRLEIRSVCVILAAFAGGIAVLGAVLAVLALVTPHAAPSDAMVAVATLLPVASSVGSLSNARAFVGRAAEPGADIVAVRSAAIIRGAVAESVGIIGIVIGMLAIFMVAK